MSTSQKLMEIAKAFDREQVIIKALEKELDDTREALHIAENRLAKLGQVKPDKQDETKLPEIAPTSEECHQAEDMQYHNTTATILQGYVYCRTRQLTEVLTKLDSVHTMLSKLFYAYSSYNCNGDCGRCEQCMTRAAVYDYLQKVRPGR